MQKTFNNTGTLLVDSILQDSYDNPTPRKDFLTFFLWFESKLSYKISDEDFKSVEIYNHTERPKWEKISINKKQFWKFNQIIKTLFDKRILTRTGWLANIPNKQGHARMYSYSQAFLNALNYAIIINP